MTIQPIADLDGLKTRIRATWMAGDYSSVAALTESAANDFIDRRQIKPNMQVLDVACGNGNLSIPAAKAGAAVTGVDISPNLLDQARARATREKLNIRFEEGDAENLPVAAGAFDLVVSMFGQYSRRDPTLSPPSCAASVGPAGRSRWRIGRQAASSARCFGPPPSTSHRPPACRVRCNGAMRRPFVNGSAPM